VRTTPGTKIRGSVNYFISLLWGRDRPPLGCTLGFTGGGPSPTQCRGGPRHGYHLFTPVPHLRQELRLYWARQRPGLVSQPRVPPLCDPSPHYIIGQLLNVLFACLLHWQYKFGATLLTKESPSEFKFYASGRLYCESVTATLTLRRRHDLYAYLW
jgi:hypothetical protein